MPIELADLIRENKAAFDRYAELLIRWNRKINLTAITDPAQIEELHFMDSLSVAAWLKEIVSRETKILDVGTGAGFPGLPMKIALPNLDVTLVDSVKKKCDFLKEVVRSLSLPSVQVIHDRLDGKKSLDRFDLVVSRAAFKLKELLLYAKPNLKPGGAVVAMKSMGIDAEIQEARSILEPFHFSSLESMVYRLPTSGQKRQLVIYKLRHASPRPSPSSSA